MVVEEKRKRKAFRNRKKVGELGILPWEFGTIVFVVLMVIIILAPTLALPPPLLLGLPVTLTVIVSNLGMAEFMEWLLLVVNLLWSA